MTIDIASKVPKVDPVQQYCEQKMKEAFDTLTDDLLADYIKNHLLSRGAPVGSA